MDRSSARVAQEMVGVRRILTLLAVLFAGLLSNALADSTFALDLSDIGVNIAKTALSQDQRKKVSDVLADTASHVPISQALLQSRLLGAALLIDNSNEKAILLSARLRRGMKIDKAPNLTQDAVLNTLTKTADQLRKGKTKDSKLLAACLYSLILQLDKDNEDALLNEELLARQDITMTWPDQAGDGEAFKPQVPDGYKKKNKQFERKQATIKGMMVSNMGATGYIGKAVDIIFTVESGTKKGKDETPHFRRKVGKHMTISLDEAVRAVKKRYPNWEKKPTFVSFSDKYSSKDGGSAGTAYAILMSSCLEGFEIDKRFAVTGDITVDWQVGKIGGVPDKIRGARKDGCEFAIVPKENEEDVQDMILLYSISELWKIQVFSVENLSESVALVRTDRSPQTQRAMDLFAKIQAYLKKKGTSGLPRTRNALKSVLQLAPNHLSARYLLEAANGKRPPHLSLGVSIERALMAIYYLLPHVYKMKNAEAYVLKGVTEESMEESQKQLRKLRIRVHPKVDELLKAIADYQNVIDRWRGTFNDLQDERRASSMMKNLFVKQAKEAGEKRDDILEVLNKLRFDKAVMEELSR